MAVRAMTATEEGLAQGASPDRWSRAVPPPGEVV